ncbi:MAG: type III-A CRISPR-associated protein Cas10/Csm1, partial [Desulfovibrionaceae bacterium]|nr:type III-A CRISPR-associated protein Cas10/Csm1 [Desulfovibrionaceae bacterium]
MQEDVVIITIGGLLHDIGKVAHRAENRKISHTELGREFLSGILAFKDTDIPRMAAYHHSKGMPSDIARNSPLYIVYIADNISAGLDRREEGAENSGKSDQKFEAMRPLASVFNILNGNNGKSCHKLKMLGDGINWPDQNLESYKYFPDNYGAVLGDLRTQMSNFKISADSVNSLLKLLEVTLSFVPSSTNTDELSDISLFDHAKTTAALAACIRLYADAKGIADYKKEFFTGASAFYKKKAFMLCSFDLSGIQDFIYTVSGSGALKNLRARSFYLEMLAEHIADELLEAAGLSRANLIYTGGGHAYLLLPNTAVARKALADKEKFINDWLLQEFKTGLYCAFAAVECSGNDLMNKPEENKPYPELYKKLGAQLSDCKLHRYSAADIMKL